MITMNTTTSTIDVITYGTTRCSYSRKSCDLESRTAVNVDTSEIEISTQETDTGKRESRKRRKGKTKDEGSLKTSREDGVSVDDSCVENGVKDD